MNDTLRPISSDIIKSLTKKDLVTLLEGEQEIRQNMQAEIDRLRLSNKILEDQSFEVNGKYIKLKSTIFGRSSEKSGRKESPDSDSKENEIKKNQGRNRQLLRRKKSKKKLSEKYPNLPIIDQTVSFAQDVECSCCQSKMKDSGMGEVIEYLDVTPRKYSIVRQRREKYRCSHCYGGISTAPSPPRIKPGSSYSDAFIIDVALSKYCDLIPVERYASMARRQEIDLPANSLIGLTHHLAKFVKSVYMLIRKEVLSLRVIHADETRHRMLEGDKTFNWYLWGFSNRFSCYFEHHDTRAGSVASNLLLESCCQVLVSDVFSGYLKAVKDVNKLRLEKNIRKLIAAFCNSHSRRKFKEAQIQFKDEATYYIEQYKKIYEIEKKCKNFSPKRCKKIRKKMLPIFTKMKLRAEAEIDRYSYKSDMFTALNYFIKNYEGLTVFIKNPHVSIDNNSQERLLRSPVVGRKTWLGTHSKRGAETAAILFSIVESCKLNSVNPRQFFYDLVKELHSGKNPYTPRDYKLDQQRKSFPGSVALSKMQSG